MQEDSALLLKKRVDRGEVLADDDIQSLLEQSELVRRLSADIKARPDTFAGLRAYEWRLLELSHIPYANRLEQVQAWLHLLMERASIPEGFSLEGTRDTVVACHTSMITSILIRMMPEEKAKIDAGVDWILRYQSVSRGEQCTWDGTDLFTRWGGCMHSTPCYHGVVKAMVTLTEYKNQFGSIPVLEEKLDRGLEYMLEHQVYKRLSNGEPIEPNIILNFYPYPYRTNLVESLGVLKANGRMNDPRCADAIHMLKQKQRKDGFWQADASFMKSAWVDFDVPKKPGMWISYVIQQLLEG